MSILGVSNYGASNYYEESKVNKKEEGSIYKDRKENTARAAEEAKTDRMADFRSTQKYLEGLQRKNSEINILSGNKNTNRSGSSNGRTDVMIAPSILAQMASDSAAAKKYEEMLADIPALDKWADSMIHALTGSEVKYRQVWIDEDGNMGSFCITGPSEQTKKAEEQAKSEKQDVYEKRIKERKEKYQELEEKLERTRKDSMESAYLDSIRKTMAVDYKA